ncbi:MFS transporter [Mycolicibacterium mengxianglii]|uniref:MFS transporter n=1 Tax=Mycolicibacterium mengxianglii TaxID=2736649 RepID=UPI0018EF1AF3
MKRTSYPRGHSELFPTEIRATATGLITAISRVGAAVGTFLVPIGLESWGVSGIMLVAATMTLVGLVVSVMMAPETKGKSLAEASGLGAPEGPRPSRPWLAASFPDTLKICTPGCGRFHGAIH